MSDPSLAASTGYLLLQGQRVALASEFLRAQRSGAQVDNQFGVLLSGPNGVGKSCIGLLAFLASSAQRLPTVYIPSARAWVAAAKDGLGDDFFLETMWRQNADLIAASDALRRVFAAAMRDDKVGGSATMSSLRTALLKSKGPSVGVIVDEAQRLTEAVEDGKATLSLRVATAADYFLDNWHDWENANKCFVRMSIASAHDQRELTLPSGEEHRLRFVLPWSSHDVSAAASNKLSPFFIDSQRARERVLHAAGGIVRVLAHGRALVLKLGSDDAGLAHVERELRRVMTINCEQWLRKRLPDERRREMLGSVLMLLRGQINWLPVKGLYDAGLVARFDETGLIRPVSPVAASVLLEVFARLEQSVGRQALSSLSGAKRGYELESQVIKALAVGRGAVEAFALNGKRAAVVDIYNDLTATFDAMKELTVHPRSTVLFVPNDEKYPCDAISIPSEEALPIKLFEVSVTCPRNANRIEKCLSWFEPRGLMEGLRAQLPGRSFQCVFVHDDDFSEAGATATKFLGLQAAADACGLDASSVPIVSLSVLAKGGLAQMGIAEGGGGGLIGGGGKGAGVYRNAS